MKKILAGFIFVVSFLLAVDSFAVFCPPVPGDNTDNLKQCIAQAAITDKVVMLMDFCLVDPSGKVVATGSDYPISGQIVIPNGVALVGSETLWGTQVDVNFGENYSNTDSNNAAFVLKDGASIKGITFNYPVQVKGQPLIEFPPTISVQGSFCRVRDSFFPNSYVGIDATAPHGKLNMQNLEFGVFYRGIRDDQCYDIDKFEVIHGNPGMFATWSDDSAVRDWMYNNSALMEISRIDWFYLGTIFSWGTKYGILINSLANGSVGEAQIIQAGCDACQYGIYANIPSDKSQPWLLTITNYSGTAFNPSDSRHGNGISIFIANVYGVDISHSNFWGVRNSGISLINCTQVTMSDNHFLSDGWNSADNGSPAIYLKGCKYGSVSDNGGTSTRASSKGVVVEDSVGIKVHDNSFEVKTKGSSVVFTGTTSNSRSVNNDGCTQWNGDSTNLADNWCSSVPASTPIPTSVPTVTPTPTKNPTDPTPTPTPIPTRPVKTPGTPLM